MKIAMLTLSLFIGSISSHSQSAYFENDSIKYEIIHKTRSVLEPEKDALIGYFISIKMPTSMVKDLQCKGFDFWIDRLRYENSDLATNLVLYYIYNREAILIKALELDKSKWPTIKEQEIQYWKSFFEKKYPDKNRG